MTIFCSMALASVCVWGGLCLLRCLSPSRPCYLFYATLTHILACSVFQNHFCSACWMQRRLITTRGGCHRSCGDLLRIPSPDILSHDVQFSLVAQSCLTLCDPMNGTRQASLSIINSQSLPKLVSFEYLRKYNQNYSEISFQTHQND